jgi:hypothetical protein
MENLKFTKHKLISMEIKSKIQDIMTYGKYQELLKTAINLKS